MKNGVMSGIFPYPIMQVPFFLRRDNTAEIFECLFFSVGHSRVLYVLTYKNKQEPRKPTSEIKKKFNQAGGRNVQSGKMSGENGQCPRDVLFNILRAGACAFGYLPDVQALEPAHVEHFLASLGEFFHDPVNLVPEFLEHQVILRSNVICKAYGGVIVL